jgi:hypothetical protein
MKCGAEGFAMVTDYCATFDPEQNIMLAGPCVWNCGGSSHCGTVTGNYYIYKNLPLDFDICKLLKRTGVLCGRCLPEHYPLAYSYSFNCIKCQHIRWNWARYIMAAYFPLTLFYLAIIVFKINVVSSHLHALVHFSQGMSIPPLVRGMMLYATDRPRILAGMKVYFSLYGVWNLDFFRPFYTDICLGIGILPTLTLDYAIAFYPLLLMMISYLLIVLYDKNYRVFIILWRPFRALFSLFRRRNWDIRTSVIDAFSTFFFLTNIKLVGISFDLLVPTQVYHLYGDSYNYTLGLFYAPDIEYFGREHLPYAILAIAVLFGLIILPITILALYPFAFFQKFLNLLPVRWHVLHTFVDAFQGCYKDGTEPGTRDCRLVSIVYFGIRYIAFVLYGLTTDSSFFAFCAILILCGIIIVIAVQPYKKRFANHFRPNTIFFILYAIVCVVSTANQRAGVEISQNYSVFLFTIAFIIASVPLVGILLLFTHWLFMKYRHHLRWKGYKKIEGDDDEDAYCDRVMNPEAYPTIPSGRMVDCSSLSDKKE